MKREHDIQSGLLPAGYKKLEYIESTGTQCINTTYCCNNTTELEIDSQPTSIVNSGGIWVRDSHADFGLIDGSGYNSDFYFYHGNTVYRLQNSQSYYIQRSVLEFKSLTLKYHIFQYTFPNISFQQDYPLSIFVININGSNSYPMMKSKLWYAKIWDNSTIVRDFIPVLRLSDNKPGLYDLCDSICPLTNTPFYINVGTGEFLYA